MQNLTSVDMFINLYIEQLQLHFPVAVIVMSPESITVEEGDEEIKMGCLSIVNSTVDITVYDSLQNEG